MKILFIHPNMPGQYKHLARITAQDKNNQVVFITKPKKHINIPNVTKIEYTSSREPSVETHRYLIGFERAVFQAQEVWRVCKKLKDAGFIPDVICGHLGWGDGLFLKDIFPDTPVLAYFEFFYDATASDVNYLNNGMPIEPDEMARIRMKNPMHLMNLCYADWGICPTRFQLDRHPKEYHHKISLIHDGIDTDVVKPKNLASLTLPNGVTLQKGDEVVTYISRNFEPYRGFPEFMRAAEIIQKNRPNCHIIMVGQDGVSYGKAPKGGKTYRQMMMEEVKLDMSRFHFLGYLPYDEMLKVLQISSAHIYLTVPFVLSWSMMEAMSAGCLIIASDTEPVREVMAHEKEGLLVDFFSHEEIAKAVDRVFASKDRMQHIRDAARQKIVDYYALNKVLPLHLSLIEDLGSKKLPPPTAEKIKALYK